MTRSLPLLLLLSACGAPAVGETDVGDTDDTDVPVDPCAWTFDLDYARVFAVGPDHDYDEIQDAIDAAIDASGGTVAIAAGTYEESLDIAGADDLVVVGQCAEQVILEGGDSYGIAIDLEDDGDTVDLANLTIARSEEIGLQVAKGTVTIRDVVIDGNTDLGLLVTGTGSDVLLERVIVSNTQMTSSGSYGYGVDIEGGATATLRDVVISANHQQGLQSLGAGTLVVLEDVEVIGTLPDEDGYDGGGLIAYGGGHIDGTRVHLHDLSASGALANADGTILLTDSTISDVATDPSDYGAGIVAYDGGVVEMVGGSLLRNTWTNAVAEGSSLVLTDTTVLDPLPDRLGEATGIQLMVDAALDATGITVERCVGAGIIVRGGSVATLDGVTVRDIAANGGTGGGLLILEGSDVVATDVTVEGAAWYGVDVETDSRFTALRLAVSDIGDRPNLGLGVLAQRSGVVVATDSSVVDSYGAGWTALRGGSLTLIGVRADNTAGYGMGALGEGDLLDLTDVVIENTAPYDGQFGIGLMVATGATLTGERVDVLDNHHAGVQIQGTATIAGMTVSGTKWIGGTYGRGIEVHPGGVLALSDAVITGNREAGMEVDGGTVTLDAVEISGTTESPVTLQAIGLLLRDGGTVDAIGLVASDNAGPGLVVGTGGAMTCTGCAIAGNRFAGVALEDGAITLIDSDIVDTLEDPEWGGGIGIHADAKVGAPSITVSGGAVSGNPLAAVYLVGAGRYDLDGVAITGGSSIELYPARQVHGDGLIARAGVGPWDGLTGLRLANSTLTDSAEAGVLLHDASATFEANAWSGNEVDVVQQACGAAALPIGIEDVPSATVCPAYDALMAPVSWDFLLTESAVVSTE